MTTAEYIGYYHGTILGSHSPVTLRARRREAAAFHEQYKREHPELYSKKPLSKRKKQKLKKRLARQNPDSTG